MASNSEMLLRDDARCDNLTKIKIKKEFIFWDIVLKRSW